MKPNIIFVIADEVRAKNLSLYDSMNEVDSNIKKIASESVVFTQNISPSNGSWPSSTSLFTAKYPANHGIIRSMPYTTMEEIDRLRKNKFWLPLYLQSIGYDTYLLSGLKAWFKKGFNYVKSDEKARDSYRKINNNAVVRRIIKLFPDWLYITLKNLTRRDQTLDFPKRGEMLNLAISKIKEAKGPFFIFIHFEDAHYPWATTPTPRIDNGKSRRSAVKNILSKSQKKYAQRRLFNLSANSFEEVEGKYNNAIKILDDDIGKLYSYLKEQKLWDNTIFVLMGDHGLSIAEHEIYIHHSGLYDETIRVPLIMHIPGIKHKVIDELVQNVDVAPTILELLKGKINESDGKSLLSLIKIGKPIRDKAFSFDGCSINRWCVRTREKKIIFSNSKNCLACKGDHCSDVEEYDLVNDKNEMNNLNSGKYELRDFDSKIKIK